MANVFGDRGGVVNRMGSRGPPGRSGPPGPVGERGPSEAKGDRGAKGYRGEPGRTGESGAKGCQGVAGSKGDRGSPGLKGPPGSITDLCTWMPNTILKNLQENKEASCFFVAEPSKDIKRGGGGGGGGGDIKQWISRSQNHLNLEAERASKSLTELPNDRHALVFHNSRYINEDILLLVNYTGSHGFICVTFRASGDHDQTILSNFEKGTFNWHEIAATNTEINIYGKENGNPKRVNIHHGVHNWTTLFVQHATAKGQTHRRYIINNDPKLTGSFTLDCSDVSKLVSK